MVGSVFGVQVHAPSFTLFNSFSRISLSLKSKPLQKSNKIKTQNNKSHFFSLNRSKVSFPNSAVIFPLLKISSAGISPEIFDFLKCPILLNLLVSIFDAVQIRNSALFFFFSFRFVSFVVQIFVQKSSAWSCQDYFFLFLF